MKANRQKTLSSHHEGGVFVTLLDGSVRFLSENVDFRTAITPAAQFINGPPDSAAERLMAIHDGEPLG
ncbi:MAG TPA: DUF1559 domain-containing protein [Caulifigura sp.]|nr:DUF1559 domain-containing protein [Caulifigura sp.]